MLTRIIPDSVAEELIVARHLRITPSLGFLPATVQVAVGAFHGGRRGGGVQSRRSFQCGRSRLRTIDELPKRHGTVALADAVGQM